MNLKKHALGLHKDFALILGNNNIILYNINYFSSSSFDNSQTGCVGAISVVTVSPKLS